MSPTSSGELMYKVVLIGEGAVGKTSIRRNFLGKGFMSSHIATIGVDFAQKYVSVNQHTVRLVIWDLAGQTGFERVRKHYYQGCSALILVYSVVDRKTFENITWWLVEAFKYNQMIPPTAILANKIDLRSSETNADEVSTEEGLQFRDIFVSRLEVPAIFLETSAKTGENIQEAFTELTKILIDEDKKRKMKLT
ncbi:MAG: GTP-binding protein [Candidatus Thorarchaeota archaeon]|nr:GTP-binding protein [Candidatus Thorarchaeota archaeon]